MAAHQRPICRLDPRLECLLRSFGALEADPRLSGDVWTLRIHITCGLEGLGCDPSPGRYPLPHSGDRRSS